MTQLVGVGARAIDMASETNIKLLVEWNDLGEMS